MKCRIKAGSRVEFTEMPAWLEPGTVGTVTEIFRFEDYGPLVAVVTVAIPGYGNVLFDLDGSPWSKCQEFKRKTVFVK